MGRRAVAVATTMLWAGCSGTPERTHNPPPPEPQIAPVPVPTPVPAKEYPPAERLEGGAEWSAYPKALNPRIDNLTVYRPWRNDGPPSCVVYPDDGQMRPPGAMPPPKTVDCGPIMQDPVWDLCPGGDIHSDEAGTGCACFTFGNPPPPAYRLSRCPTI